jgi:hypothetical protein
MRRGYSSAVALGWLALCAGFFVACMYVGCSLENRPRGHPGDLSGLGRGKKVASVSIALAPVLATGAMWLLLWWYRRRHD